MVRRIVIFLLFAILPLSLMAQTTGKIAGTVTSKETGEPLAGVNIIVDGPGTTLGTASGADGSFTIINVPVATYTVRFSYMGKKDYVLKNVSVSVGLTYEINVELEDQVIEGEVVTVTAKRQLVRKDETNTNVIKNAEDIDNMPVRGVQNIVATTAGVVKQEKSNVMNIRGGRGGETAMYVDGVLVNDPYNSAVRVNLPNNAIEEMSVQTGGFNAEYGEAMSGIIAITTQVGSEDYHGSVEAITDEFLSADDKMLGAYSYGYSEYTATMSGPIIPNTKHTFFVSGNRRYAADAWPSWGWVENDDKLDSYTYTTPLVTGYEQDSLGNYLPDNPVYGDTLTKEYDFNARIPDNSTSDWTWTAKAKFQITDNMKIRGSYIRTDRLTSGTANLQLFNQAHDDETDLYSESINATLVHNITPNTFYEAKFNYFDTQREIYDKQYGSDLRKYGHPNYNLYPDITDDLDPELADLYRDKYFGEAYRSTQGDITPDFNAYGEQDLTYFKNRTTYWGVDFDITHQMGDHTFKAGFDYRYHTLRRYTFVIGGPQRLTSKNGYVADIEGNPIETWMNADVDFYGYDIEGNEVDDGDFLEDVQRSEDGTPQDGYQKQAPYNPILMSAYIQDKIEYNDLILNLGLRYDHVDPNAWMFKELAADFDENGVYTEGTGMFGGNSQFDNSDTKESEAYSFISPRMGFSFPVTDRTVFHGNYGMFYQRPNLQDLYLSPFFLNTFVTNGGYFTAIENPNLRPSKTTSYEMGLKQMVSDFLALNLSVFYKETEDNVQIVPITTDVTNIAFFDNGDYGIIKGFDVNLSMRRMSNVKVEFNYEMQFADGTGSASGSNFDIAWQQGTLGNFPKFQQPLAFEQRHTGNVSVDYRFGNDGPGFLKNFGVNMLGRFNSGQRFTRMLTYNSKPYTGALDRDTDSQKPISAVNGETMPWNYNFDLRIDKAFYFGNTRVLVYANVLNLFNTKNILDVYYTTGQPDESGYKGTSSGRDYYSQLTEEEYKLVRMRETDWRNYGMPRQIRLGLRIEL